MSARAEQLKYSSSLASERDIDVGVGTVNANRRGVVGGGIAEVGPVDRAGYAREPDRCIAVSIVDDRRKQSFVG